MAKVAASADKAAESLDNLARSAGYEPKDSVGDLRAYERPDGSTLITNDYQSLKDDINKKDLLGLSYIAIVSGASTPKHISEEVKSYIESLFD